MSTQLSDLLSGFSAGAYSLVPSPCGGRWISSPSPAQHPSQLSIQLWMKPDPLLGPLAGILGSLACGLLHTSTALPQLSATRRGPEQLLSTGAWLAGAPFSERELWSCVSSGSMGLPPPPSGSSLRVEHSRVKATRVTCETEKKAHRRSQPVHEKARDSDSDPAWALPLLHTPWVILECQAGPYTYVMSSLSGWA